MKLIEPEQITKMMSDLFISKDAVNMTGEHQGLWVRFRAIEKAVSEITTIDAVEVVRCKDCKYWKEGKCWNLKGLNKTDGIVNADDFCSYGEREDGEE